MKKFILLLFAIMLLPRGTAMAQIDSTASDSIQSTFYLVTKTDGGEFYGYIIQDDGREILLMTKTIGKIFISKADIKSIVPVEAEEVRIDANGIYRDYRNKGPFTTRYYFTTNALPIEKGENYALLHLYGPEVHFALSDRFSLGVMASWIASPIALAAKYNLYSKDKNHLALGTIMGSSGYLGNAEGYGGLHWLSATRGDRLANITVSAGYGYIYYSDFFGDLGPTYSFRSGDPMSERYEVGNYDAQAAIANKLFADQNRQQFLYDNSTRSGLVLGLSGIAPVGKKASFIFDSMVLRGKAKKAVYSDYPINVNYYDPWSGQNINKDFVIGQGRIIEEGHITTMILMPAMRFSQSYSKAFQVALAGVVQVKDGKTSSFPLPMVSWLRQF